MKFWNGIHHERHYKNRRCAMASVRFGGALGNIEITKTGKAPAGKLSPINIKELVTRSISPTQLIPVELLDEIAKEFARSGSFNDKSSKAIQFTAGSSDGRTRPSISGNSIFSTPKAAEQITGLMKGVARVHYAYYAALLKSMDEVIQDPGVPAGIKKFSKKRGKITGIKKNVKFSRPVTLKVDELPGKPFSNRIRLSGRWAGLAETTIKAKQALGTEPQFWRHTGESSAAFHSAVTSRLARIKPRDFIVMGNTAPVITGGTLARQGAGKRVAQAKYSFKLGIPSWDAKMDALITIPFASGQIVSTLSATGLRNRPKLRGIDRILAAEAMRPWLRDLSSQAGQARDAYIKGGVFTQRTTPIVSGATSPLQKKVERLLKKKAGQEVEAPTLASVNVARLMWGSRHR
jgi:hypothetical protein